MQKVWHKKAMTSSSFPAKKTKKVLVGMSGGVDSSVTACILKDQGYDVIGIHLRFWTDPTIFSRDEIKKFPQNKCCTLEGLIRTRQICHRLGIPFYVLNFEENFKRDVVDFFVDGYGRGITPNPCIECNRNIKFGLFLKKMNELGADYIATGHYARKMIVCSGGRRQYQLWAAQDKTKDQSYFLYTLTQEKLKHVLFPLGEFTKAEVRQMAQKYGIPEVIQQKESQNLCFFPEAKHTGFLKRHLGKYAFMPGPIMTIAGKRLGTHQGLPSYTIGQRKGLGIGGIKDLEDKEGQGWYVVRIDRNKNTIVVGRNSDLFTSTFKAHTLSFVEGKLSKNTYSLQAKIRYRFPQQNVTLKIESKENSDIGFIEFQRPQRAITPGQSVVFYEGEKVFGGGIIG